MRVISWFCAGLAAFLLAGIPLALAESGSSAESANASARHESSAVGKVAAMKTGKHGMAAHQVNAPKNKDGTLTRAEVLEREKSKRPDSSSYEKWKRKLPFWPQKGVLLVELALIFTVGILIGQALELSGALQVIAVLTRPLTHLGGLPKEAGPPFLIAFQSGAAANSMLVNFRDAGILNRRQLYTSVLVVSCLSLFAHLPTFFLPLGLAFGWKATYAFFSVRVLSVVLEIVVVLLVSNWIIRQFWPDATLAQPAPGTAPASTVAAGTVKAAPSLRTKKFWVMVWSRSRKTLRRLLLCLAPTFAVMSLLEYYDFFTWLTNHTPGIFQWSFLPSQAAVIVPAQAVNLYNGAIAAANYVDSGEITVRQAVIVLLFGSIFTSPLRTLRHAVPTYVAVLGPRAGMTMAISAQVLRILFQLLCIFALLLVWRG